MAAYAFPRRYRRGRYRRRGGSSSPVPVVIAVAVLAAGASAKTVTAVHRPAHARPRVQAAPAPVTAPSGNVTLGASIASGYGWGSGSQWNCLYDLWERESGWQNDIANRQSFAFGIAQALGHGGAGTAAVDAVVRFPDGTAAGNVTVNEYPSQAANSGDAGAQIRWGLTYIQGTYGTPCGAWAHEEANGWY